MSFGACVSHDGKKIYIAGGTSGDKKKSMNETFEYDIIADKWTKLGELNQPRFSSSLILFNNKLICLGGQDQDHNGKHVILSSFEVLDLGIEGSNWYTASNTLTYKACSPGALVISMNELLVFGGWNLNNLDNVCRIKETSTGEFIVKDSEKLQQADKFLLNGIKMRHSDTELNIFGVDYVHQYNENKGTFNVL